jgi:hypothetical protein
MTKWKSRANWKDPEWKYVSAAATDISKTYARVIAEMKELEKKGADKQKVVQIRHAK